MDGKPGQIIILNGAPRSGKSSIAEAIQATFDGIWMNLGVDVAREMTPERYRPGIGLRPGGERPDLEKLIPILYAALYESIAAHSRLGLNVVADMVHHDSYSKSLGLLPDCARRLAGLSVLFVGVHCDLETILERRSRPQAGRENLYVTGTVGQPVPPPVLLWQRDVHKPGLYDFEVDTSKTSAVHCAEKIKARLAETPQSFSAFPHLARR